MDITTEDKLDLLRRMVLIRAFEERVIDLYHRGDIAGLVHVGIGQEAVAVAVATSLLEGDYLYGTHRSHGHFIARGADINKMMAELAGRANGYCEGLGGSMHLVAAEVKAMGATGIVGGTIPLALGTALAHRDAGLVVAVYFGDGAANTGGFHESLNIAALWKLPVVLVCENNGYAEFTPMSEHTVVERVSEHCKPYGIPARTVDGNDLLEVLEAMSRAVEHARNGEGPTMVECLTYRLRGHYIGDPAQYRQANEVAEWREKDPIERLTKQLKSERALDEDAASTVKREADERVEDAVRFALGGEYLSMDAMTARVFG
ncbi:MAG: thiamine pyrophosphate-dependent dehydrogenase E1 component subunit alpha [Chloroflexi bacterium]|nr:thiamine pyrophosphate-dependent dehydrogenase E1 component subunit alpha [Chloroflexota bacterium]